MEHAHTYRRKRTWHHAWKRVGGALRHSSGLMFDVTEESMEAHVQSHSLMQYLQRQHDAGMEFCEMSPAYERLVAEAQVWVRRNWHGQWDPRTKQVKTPQPA